MEQHQQEEQERAPSLRETLLPTIETFLTNDGERKVARRRAPKDDLTGITQSLYIQDDESNYRYVDLDTLSALIKRFMVANDATALWNPNLPRKVARFLMADAPFLDDTVVKA